MSLWTPFVEQCTNRGTPGGYRRFDHVSHAVGVDGTEGLVGDAFLAEDGGNVIDARAAGNGGGKCRRILEIGHDDLFGQGLERFGLFRFADHGADLDPL